MDVLLNQEEEMIRDGLRRFFETECATDRVRGIEDGETRIDENLWQQLAELGWLGLALPAAYGGGEAPFRLGPHEAVGQGVAFHHQRMITRRREWAGNDFEEPRSVVVDIVGFAVHQSLGRHNGRSGSLADRLMSQANSQQRNLSGKLLYAVNRDPCFIGRTRAGRNDQVAG